MGRSWPALDICGVDSPDLMLALLDDFSPTAVEEREFSLRAFFGSAQARDQARYALAGRYSVEPIDLPDENWARRSQNNLSPITVERTTISPRPQHPATPAEPAITIVIQPSMGFGTGHHATTRLCLRALQTLDLTNAVVLDVGTGSGILAIAASRLGAAKALGIDHDTDAVQAARENLALNPDARNVAFEVADLLGGPLPQADVVVANLTGALLVRAGPVLGAAARDGGALIVSGLLGYERADVLAALSSSGGLEPTWEGSEEEWLCLVLRPPREK